MSVSRCRGDPRPGGPGSRGLLGLLVGSAWGQTESVPASGSRAGLSIEPRLSVTQTVTDNLRLSSTSPDRALITTIAPGVSIVSRSGMLRGSLDYSLNGLIYTKTSQADQTQQNLNAQATLEAVPNWLYVDGRASIGQQAISAYGLASTDNALVNANRTETATLSLVALCARTTRFRGGLPVARRSLGNARKGYTLQGRLGPAVSQLDAARASGDGRLLNWSFSLSDNRSLLRTSRDTRTSNATGGLSYKPDVDWQLGANAG